MKKFILYFILSFLPMVTLAQKDTAHSKTKGIIKIYPLQAIVGEIRLGYEQPLTKHLSVEVSPGYVFGVIGGEYDGELGVDGRFYFDKVKGFAVRTAIKIFTSQKKSQAGFYISPLALYKNTYSGYYSAYFPFNYISTNYKFFAVQILFGYRFLNKKGLTFEPYMGVGYKQSYSESGRQASYFTIQMGTAIGYRISKK